MAACLLKLGVVAETLTIRMTRSLYTTIFPRELVLLFSDQKFLLIRYAKNYRYMAFDILARNILLRNLTFAAFIALSGLGLYAHDRVAL